MDNLSRRSPDACKNARRAAALFCVDTEHVSDVIVLCADAVSSQSTTGSTYMSRETSRCVSFTSQNYITICASQQLVQSVEMII